MDENNTQDQSETVIVTTLTSRIEQLVTETEALQAKVDEQTNEMNVVRDRALIDAKSALIDALDDQVNGNDVEQETASVIFAEFANRLGKTGIWKNPYKNKYTVTIEHDYSDVLVISGVEAEDEDDAIELVKEDLSIESSARKGTLTYSGKYSCGDDAEIEEDTNDSDWEEYDLTFSAEKE